MNYQQIQTRFDAIVGKGKSHNPNHEKILLGALTRACGGKDNRYLVTQKLFGRTHSSEFLPAEWYALFCFCFPKNEYDNFIMKNEATGKWEGRPELSQWCGLILEAQARQEGQAEMFTEVKP